MHTDKPIQSMAYLPLAPTFAGICEFQFRRVPRVRFSNLHLMCVQLHVIYVFYVVRDRLKPGHVCSDPGMSSS